MEGQGRRAGKARALAPGDAQVLGMLEKLLNHRIPWRNELEEDHCGYTREDQHVSGISLYEEGLRELPAEIWSLQRLRQLDAGMLWALQKGILKGNNPRTIA